jgi:hypothetical protein
MAGTPQLMSFHTPDNSTPLPHAQPFVTTHGTQHVQGTGTTLQPQDEYELSWMGNNPLHFVHIICSPDTHLSQADTLAIPTVTHDDDKSTTPTIRTSGGAVGGDRAAELHEEGTDALTTRDPNPQPISLARSNLSRRSHDKD